MNDRELEAIDPSLRLRRRSREASNAAVAAEARGDQDAAEYFREQAADARQRADAFIPTTRKGAADLLRETEMDLWAHYQSYGPCSTPLGELPHEAEKAVARDRPDARPLVARLWSYMRAAGCPDELCHRAWLVSVALRRFEAAGEAGAG